MKVSLITASAHVQTMKCTDEVLARIRREETVFFHKWGFSYRTTLSGMCGRTYSTWFARSLPRLVCPVVHARTLDMQSGSYDLGVDGATSFNEAVDPEKHTE